MPIRVTSADLAAARAHSARVVADYVFETEQMAAGATEWTPRFGTFPPGHNQVRTRMMELGANVVFAELCESTGSTQSRQDHIAARVVA